MTNLFSSYDNFIAFGDNLILFFLLAAIPFIIILPFLAVKFHGSPLYITVLCTYKPFVLTYIITGLLYAVTKFLF